MCYLAFYIVDRRERSTTLSPPSPFPSFRSANVSATGASSKAHYVAREDDTSRAGAVYVFSRLTIDNTSTSFSSSSSSSFSAAESVCTDDDDTLTRPERRYFCPRGGERGQCRWEESAKLTASDRRRGDLFGGCLSVDHDTGVVVVGAPGASLAGLWREVCVKCCLRGLTSLCLGKAFSMQSEESSSWRRRESTASRRCHRQSIANVAINPA